MIVGMAAPGTSPRPARCRTCDLYGHYHRLTPRQPRRRHRDWCGPPAHPITCCALPPAMGSEAGLVGWRQRVDGGVKADREHAVGRRCGGHWQGSPSTIYASSFLLGLTGVEDPAHALPDQFAHRRAHAAKPNRALALAVTFPLNPFLRETTAWRRPACAVEWSRGARPLPAARRAQVHYAFGHTTPLGTPAAGKQVSSVWNGSFRTVSGGQRRDRRPAPGATAASSPTTEQTSCRPRR